MIVRFELRIGPKGGRVSLLLQREGKRKRAVVVTFQYVPSGTVGKGTQSTVVRSEKKRCEV